MQSFLPPGVKLNVVLTGLDLLFLALALLNLVLFFVGMGKFAVFSAMDSVIYFFFPRWATKYDHRTYYPPIMKDPQGNTISRFRTSRDEFAPDAGPFLGRLVDFIMRFPWFILVIYFVGLPILQNFFVMILKYIQEIYPNIFSNTWFNTSRKFAYVFMLLMFMPYSSIHTIQVSSYALIRPFLRFKNALPAILYTLGFAILFFQEAILVYVGFLPLFHKGIIPFIDNDAGLKQLIFWEPVKFKMYVDLVLIPLVIMVPLTTSVGSFILAKHDEEMAGSAKPKINFLVLFYKTGIAYLYGPILGILFAGLREESAKIREERRINEILVMAMYVESLICVAGTAYAYFTIAQSANLPMSGIIMGMLVLCMFVPLIVFSTNGFQSFCLDKATTYWRKSREPINAA